jgi:two-component system response regulator
MPYCARAAPTALSRRVHGSILVADDDPIYANLLRGAIARAMPATPILHFDNGEEVIRLLTDDTQTGRGGAIPTPRILLLDLHMPKKGGLEVLEWMRTQPRLRSLPVIVISTSEDTATVKKAYELGARGFLAKPYGAASLRQLAAVLKSWLSSNSIPEMPAKLNFL